MPWRPFQCSPHFPSQTIIIFLQAFSPQNVTLTLVSQYEPIPTLPSPPIDKYLYYCCCQDIFPMNHFTYIMPLIR